MPLQVWLARQSNEHICFESQRQVKQLAALRLIDTAISSSQDLQFTLDVLLNQVIAQLDVDAAVIYLDDQDLSSQQRIAWQGFSSGEVLEHALKIYQAHASQVTNRQELFFIPDLQANQCREVAPVDGFPYLSMFGIPLIIKNEACGVLSLFSKKSFNPSAEWLSFFEILAGQAAIAIENKNLFDNLQRSIEEQRQAYDETIAGWARALEMKDMETVGHSQRVTDLTVQLAREMGIDEGTLEHIQRGALLHDIGKMAVPDSILRKPGPLDDDEWTVMRHHPVYAYEWLSGIKFLKPALDIPFCHHEKWDGSGYPRGLKGEEIPLAARIFALVDVWDALRSERPYRASWSEDVVRQYLEQQSGKHFDPRVVQVFLDYRSEYTEGDYA